MTTFFPSFLLIAITYATTFFKPFFFEAALTVNLTVMLVITTLFISVMDKLPPTSYIKWTEMWLIFAQLIPFTEVILLTILERYRDESIKEINHHGNALKVEEEDLEENLKKVSECWTEENSQARQLFSTKLKNDSFRKPLKWTATIQHGNMKALKLLQRN